MATPSGAAILPRGIDERSPIQFWHCPLPPKAHVPPFFSWMRLPLIIGCGCGLKSFLHRHLCFIYALLLVVIVDQLLSGIPTSSAIPLQGPPRIG
jgi:hypothetical protein